MVGLKTTGFSRLPEARVQLLRYIVVGAANTAFAWGAYAFGLFVGLPYALASLLALALGLVVSFVTHGRLVFAIKLRGRFLIFTATWAVLYLANITVIRALHWAGLDLYSAGLVAAVPVTVVAFLLQRGLVFANPPLSAQRTILIGLLVLLAIARLDLVLSFEANWDEFLNLAMVHSYARGELREVLQTAFVHLFTWLPGVAVNEVDQVIAARFLVLLFAAITSLAIYGTARRFMAVSPAIISVLAFNGFSFVMRHGISVRTDPLATCCLMIAIWLAVSRHLNPKRAIVLGILVGLAGVLTIKSFFYVPTVGAILLLQLWYSADRKREALHVAVAGLASLATFGFALWLHGTTFPATASASAFVARTSGATLFSGDYSIVLDSLGQALARNFAFWVLLITGVACAAAVVSNPSERRDNLALLSFALVLVSALIYRDVYPYYYPFMLAPASILVGFGFARLSGLRGGIYSAAAIALLFASAAFTYLQSRQQDNRGQHKVLDLIHRLFPAPVAYIDHTAMVSTYPKQGFFMSRWGVTDYRQTNAPVMAGIIDQKEPRFLLVTRDLLDVEQMNPAESESRRYGLLAEDVRALQANYLRYWGPLYLPGFRVQGETSRFVHIPGRYLVDSNSPVTVDGRSIVPGAAVELAKGEHSFSSSTPARIRWEAPLPPNDIPPRQLFRGF